MKDNNTDNNTELIKSEHASKQVSEYYSKEDITKLAEYAKNANNARNMYKKAYDQLIDPSNQISLAEKNLIQCIHFISLLGYLDPELITDDLLQNPKKCLHLLATSNDNSTKMVVSALRYIATLPVKVSGASIVSLIDMMVRFGCSPLLKEVYLINSSSKGNDYNSNNSWACMNYLFKTGYCFRHKLVSKRIVLPEITKDLKGDGSNDTCSITLYPTDGDSFEFSRKRSEIAPFLKGVLAGSPDLGFKKTVISQAINMCFASEFAGVYIPEEMEADENIDKKNISNIVIDTSDYNGNS